MKYEAHTLAGDLAHLNVYTQNQDKYEEILSLAHTVAQLTKIDLGQKYAEIVTKLDQLENGQTVEWCVAYSVKLVEGKVTVDVHQPERVTSPKYIVRSIERALRDFRNIPQEQWEVELQYNSI